MAELYRKSAIERLSAVDRTDKTMSITGPLSWLALIGITIIILVAGVWSFVGEIPVTVTGKGIVASPDSTNTLFMEESGTVISLIARQGMDLYVGDPVLTYQTANGESRILYSNQVGRVTQVLVKEMDSVTQGKEVVRISPIVMTPQVAVAYVKLADSQKIQKAMGENSGVVHVQVYLDSANSQTYGYISGQITNIDTRAASSESMKTVLGENNNLTASMTGNNEAVSAVTCGLIPVNEENNVSGYAWSTERGKALKVENGAPVTVKVIVETVHPIEKAFIKLKEILGD